MELEFMELAQVPFKMPLQGSLNLVWGDQTYIKKKNCMKTPLQGSLNLVWANPYKKKLHENATIGLPERCYRYGTRAP